MPSSLNSGPDQTINYDAIVIGSGIGGLVTATQLAAKGANVLVWNVTSFQAEAQGTLSAVAIGLMLGRP